MSNASGNKSTGVRALIRVVDEVLENYPRLDLKQLAVLLRILDKPGLRATDLMRETGMSKSSLSWMLRSLGVGNYQDDGSGAEKRGQGLISQASALEDSRAKLLAPTAVGLLLANKIEKILGDSNGTSKGPPMAG